MSKIVKIAFRDGMIIGFVTGVFVAYGIVIVLFLINSKSS